MSTVKLMHSGPHSGKSYCKIDFYATKNYPIRDLEGVEHFIHGSVPSIQYLKSAYGTQFVFCRICVQTMRCNSTKQLHATWGRTYG